MALNVPFAFRGVFCFWGEKSVVKRSREYVCLSVVCIEYCRNCEKAQTLNFDASRVVANCLLGLISSDIDAFFFDWHLAPRLGQVLLLLHSTSPAWENSARSTLLATLTPWLPCGGAANRRLELIWPGEGGATTWHLGTYLFWPAVVLDNGAGAGGLLLVASAAICRLLLTSIIENTK